MTERDQSGVDAPGSRDPARSPALARALSLPVLTLYGLGNIVGAGIYVLTGQVAGAAGYAAPVAVLVAAGVAAFTAASYGQLAARYPVSAGTPVYIKAAFDRDALSVIVGLILVVSGVASAGALANGLMGAVADVTPLPRGVGIPLAFALLAAVTIKGIDESARLAVAITVVEVAGLVVVAVVGLADGGVGETVSRALDDVGGGAATGILAGAFLSFYAFVGFEDVVNVAEEVRDPRRVMPRAIVLALVLAAVIYCVVTLAAVNVLPPDALAASRAPLADVFREATGSAVPLLAVIAAVAIVNGMIAQIIMSSRILYGMAATGWLPARLATVNPRTRTPVTATVSVVVVMTGIALAGSIAPLARATSVALLVIFVLVNLALAVLIRRRTVAGRVWLPVAGALSSAGMLLAEAVRVLR